MKIRNLETGEITEVNPADAGQYGITPEDVKSFSGTQPVKTYDSPAVGNSNSNVNVYKPAPQATTYQAQPTAPITPTTQPKTLSIDEKRAKLKAMGYADADINKALGIQTAPVTPKKEKGAFSRAISGGLGDIGNIFKGLASIPIGYVDNSLKGGTFNDQTAKLVVGMGKGMVNEYSDLLGVTTENGMPILPQDKSVFEKGGFNKPTGANIDSAINHAIDHPVNTALDILPLYSALKKASGTSKAATAGEASATSGAEGLGQTPALSSSDDAARASVVPKSAVSDDAARASVVPKSAVDQYNSVFTIPTKRAKDLRPAETATSMIKYGIAGDADTLASTVKSVTGETGILTKVTKGAIADTKATVNIGHIPDVVKSVLSDAPEITAAEEAKVVGTVSRAVNATPEMSASTAFALQQRLEKLGHQYLNSSTYLTGNVKNEQFGMAYLAASDEIGKTLATAVDSSNTIQAYKTAENVAKIRAISPALAEDFLRANTIKEVRSLAAPFVRLGKMIELTEQSKNSAFANLANQMNKTSLMPETAGQAIDPISYVNKAMKMSKEKKLAEAGSMETNTNMAVSSASMKPKLGPIGKAKKMASGIGDISSAIPWSTIARTGQLQDSPYNNSSPANNINTSQEANPQGYNAQDYTNHNQYDTTPQQPTSQSAYITGKSPEYWNYQYQQAMQQNPPDGVTARYALEQRDFETKYQKENQAGNSPVTIDRFVDNLKDLYSPPNEESLSMGDETVGVPGIGARLSVEQRKLFDQSYADRLTIFNQQRAIFAGMLNRARGAGTLNAGEYETVIQNMPNEYTSTAAANAWFTETKKLLKGIDISKSQVVVSPE